MANILGDNELSFWGPLQQARAETLPLELSSPTGNPPTPAAVICNQSEWQEDDWDNAELDTIKHIKYPVEDNWDDEDRYQTEEPDLQYSSARPDDVSPTVIQSQEEDEFEDEPEYAQVSFSLSPEDIPWLPPTLHSVFLQVKHDLFHQFGLDAASFDKMVLYEHDLPALSTGDLQPSLECGEENIETKWYHTARVQAALYAVFRWASANNIINVAKIKEELDAILDEFPRNTLNDFSRRRNGPNSVAVVEIMYEGINDDAWPHDGFTIQTGRSAAQWMRRG